MNKFVVIKIASVVNPTILLPSLEASLKHGWRAVQILPGPGFFESLLQLKVTRHMSASSRRQETLLYLNPDLDDQLFFAKAVELSRTPFVLQQFSSAELALKYLRGYPPFTDRLLSPLPALVVCEYDLGSTNGAEFVRSMRQLSDCKNIPLAIINSSPSPDAVLQSYAAGANCVLSKPAHFLKLEAIVKALHAGATSDPHCFEALAGFQEYQPRPLLSSTRSLLPVKYKTAEAATATLLARLANLNHTSN